MPVKNELLYKKLKNKTIEFPHEAEAFYNLAAFLDNEEEFEAAIDYYKKAIAINPYIYQANLNLGIIYTRQQKFDTALLCWKNIIDSDSDPQFKKLNYTTMARALHVASLEWENYYKKNYPNNFSIFNTAFALLALGNIEKSKEFFEELLKESPYFENANYWLGYIYLTIKEPETASGYFAKEIERRANFIPALFSLSQTHYELGRTVKAIQLLVNIINQKSNHIKAHFLLGLCLSKQGKYQEAIVFFEKTLKLDPANSSAHYEIARVYEKQYLLDKAISEYSVAIQQNPEFKDAYFHLGLVYKNLGKAEQAAQQFKKTLELDPGDGEAHYYAGETYMQLGRIQDAVNEYKTATMLNPHHAYAYYSLGKAYFKSNCFEEAVKAYEKTLQLNPKDTLARNALGITYFRENQFTLAVEQFKKVLEINPFDPYSHYHLGAAYFQLQYFEDAIDEYQKASELNPHSAYAHFSLGASLSRQGDFEQAVEQFQKASELIPSSEADLALFSTLQLLAIIGMEHAQQGKKVHELYTDLKQAYKDTIKSLAKAIDARDPYTQFHSERVSRIAAHISKQLKLQEEEIKQIEMAGYLHDIGKLGIPDKVLLKAGKLTDEERNIIRSHPSIGSKILEDVKLPWDIIPLIKHHHEHLDGTGYPEGLKGDEIPLGAKIIGLADFFDALITDRPYHKAMTFRQASIELERLRDKYYSSNLIDVFFEIQDKIPDILKDITYEPER